MFDSKKPDIDIVGVADFNSYDEIVVYVICGYKHPPTTNERIIVGDVYYINMQRGNMPFAEGMYLHVDNIVVRGARNIIKSLFEITPGLGNVHEVINNL